MESTSFFDPQTLSWIETVPACKCNHCKTSISQSDAMRFEGCCETCWENGNEKDLAIWNYQNQYEA